jgi:hypothetical protein
MRKLQAALLVTAAMLVIVALAFGKPTQPKPKPTATADAGVTTTTDASVASTDPQQATGTGVDGGTVAQPMMASDGGGPVPPPSMLHGDFGDGGIRPSPLNPAPNEFAQGIDAGAPTVDYDKLVGDISALRARVAAVGDNLFHSRIAIQVRTDGDHGRIGRLVVSLDDGAIYTAPPNFKADDWQDIYSHALAPGRHAITVDVDRKDDRNDGFRNSQRSRFTVEVPRDQELAVQIKIGDDSNMGKDFPGDKEGNYDLRVRLKAEARQPRAGH